MNCSRIATRSLKAAKCLGAFHLASARMAFRPTAGPLSGAWAKVGTPRRCPSIPVFDSCKPTVQSMTIPFEGAETLVSPSCPGRVRVALTHQAGGAS
jgi:hypothetical protein